LTNFYQNTRKYFDFHSILAGSVLRMMQVALGVDTWTKGLKNYLLTKQYDAATSDDLYSGLQQAVNEDYPTSPPNVATIMRTWENQAGYPVITVSRNGDQLTLTQERFFYTNASSSSNVWWVPINYVVGSNPDFSQTKPDAWMPGQKSVTLQSSTAPKPWTNDDWVVVNIQESSYYRVNYDDNLWNLLIEQLNSNNYEQIHLLNRAQLVDDSLNLARAGKISYDVPFGILGYLSKEADYIPWASVSCFKITYSELYQQFTIRLIAV
jgi:aminopeptidase N